MKVTLSFDLPEERDNLDCALKGNDYKIIINDLDQLLRSKLKYETLSEEVHLALTDVRRCLHDLKLERNLE